MNIRVYEVTGENAMTREAGEKLYAGIHPLLLGDQEVALDFSDVKRHLTVYFNFAIGQLYRDISADKVRAIQVSNLSPVGVNTLNQVHNTAQQYYSDETYRQAVNSLVEEQSICL